MQKNKIFSIITVICFITVIFIPIGLAIMWFSTEWKKKIKIIITSVLASLYVVMIILLLGLQPSINTKGIKIPVNSDYYDYLDVSSDSAKTESELVPATSDVQLTKTLNFGTSILVFLFFLLIIVFIVIQNLRDKKKTKSDNPYVDTSLYKLSLTKESIMPMVHYLNLDKKPEEEILFASKTITKNNPRDFVITNQRVVCSGLEENYELSLSSLEAALSVSNSVMKLTSGTRKYFIIFPGDQLKYALAVLRWACSKI